MRCQHMMMFIVTTSYCWRCSQEKKPIDNSFQDNLNLHNFIKTTLLDRIVDIIDPILFWEREGGQNGSQKIKEYFILILGIGVAYSTKFPRQRMSIASVVVELHLSGSKDLE